ncbi:hypothetical protein [Pelotomaculum propionicicum]|uniref:Uncharacterized protein n=1 Tax=Pelotomaculum propionicicum TaxID=258475 RepID=A0A4Y7RKE3_9FIRM|nr:hypothetical protein [Pelotomaculum propionicicum]TEB08787.1 hypothetical protein Pmgp_03635 [Pelotomaculum propionicicum]
MDRWPCFDCRHYDTFDRYEDDDMWCKLGHAVTHMTCDFREPFTIHPCGE